MSAQGPAITHYEVYAHDGQRWILHARFRREEKEDALMEAKQVEQGLGVAAKVVREIYYPANNTSEESLIYTSDKSFRPTRSVAVASLRGRGYARTGSGLGTPAVLGPDVRGSERPRSAAGSLGVLLKLLLIVAISLAIAGGVTGIVDAFVAKMPPAMAVGPSSASLLLFAAFVIAFLACAVPLSMSFIDWRDKSPREAAIRRRPPPPAVKPKPIVEAPGQEGDQPAEEEEKDEEGEEVEAEGEAPTLPEAEIAPIEPLPPQDAKDGQPAADEKQEMAEPPKEEADPVQVSQMEMVRFLGSLLTEIKKTRPTLDAYNKFGIDLMLAGAVDLLGQTRNLDSADRRRILKETIEVMGARSESAKSFADKYEDYLVEAKYMSMVQAGRSAMEAFLSGADRPDVRLSKLFDAWNKPLQANQAAPRIMTILFTDMVGSTDLTQSRGDVAAQDLVRRHNSIVRAALAEFSGREVKHTGDGIMASFASAANGVEAAVAIQKATAAHNQKHRDLPLHLRIGINAGEPIEEEDDLFGTTVQLAARVCANSGVDEIYCTNVVRELSAGKSLTFVPRGDHDLKGFKQKVQLFEVLWKPQPVGVAPASGETPGGKASQLSS
jgi:class 3 adenylate cyclase